MYINSNSKEDVHNISKKECDSISQKKSNRPLGHWEKQALESPFPHKIYSDEPLEEAARKSLAKHRYNEKW